VQADGIVPGIAGHDGGENGDRVTAMDAIREESDDESSHSMDVTRREGPLRPAFQPDLPPQHCTDSTVQCTAALYEHYGL
jgi:hypothetical protein